MGKNILFMMSAVFLLSGADIFADDVESDSKGLIFHVSFDKGLDANIAKGCPTATGCAEITTGKKGFTGEALIAKSGWYGVEQYTGVKYLSSGNITFSQGTVEFYLKPLPGFINDKKKWRKIFICMYDKEFINNKRFYRWFRMDCSRKLGKRLFRVYEKDMHTQNSAAYLHAFMQNPYPALKENKWYHLAYCWDGEKRWFFINGELFATGKSKGSMPKAGTHIFVGSGPHGGEASHALIDELKIWDRVKYKINNQTFSTANERK